MTANRSHRDRVIFHDALQAMEIDLSGASFASAADADAFYDEVDRRVAGTERRWYFLINYADCVIAPEA